jgi:tetratricopeptide (TPR) repeat protein
MGFAQLRVLIIEDHAEMRASIRAMVIRFGAQNVDVVNCGEDAIEALKVKSYDLILSDYELGRGKDGQQILEEVRFSGLIPASATYVLVTAAQTLEMVMGALEYQPDGYITKPVTYDVIHSRLMKILRHKAYFSEINQAIDNKNILLAIQECDRMVLKQPKLATHAFRIKAKLLLNTQQYDEAEQVYRQVFDSHGLAWAQLGLAQCMRTKQDYSSAIELLKTLIATNDKYVECYDLLAKIYLELDQPAQAQAILEQAIEQSPKAVLRQSELSKIAFQNKNMEVAAKAARKAINLSKNSCHHSPKNYLTLAKSLQDLLINGSQRDKTLSAADIEGALKEVQKNFPADTAAQLEAKYIEGLTLYNQGKSEKAQKVIQETQTLYADALLYLSTDTEQFLQDTLNKVGMKSASTPASKPSIPSASAEKKPPTPSTPPSNAPTKTEQQIETERVAMENINNKGVELFQQGQVAQALELFETAASKEDAKISVILNTLQAMLVLMQQQMEIDVSEFKKCHEYFKRLNTQPVDPNNRKRQEKLQAIYYALNPPENLHVTTGTKK